MVDLFSPVEKRFLTGMTLTMSLRQLGLLLVMPFLSVYALELKGGTASLAGLAIGIYGLTQAVLQIPNGLLSDRIGRKPVVLITMVIFTSGLVLAAIAKNVETLIIARAIQGGGAVAAVLFSWIGDEIPDQKRNRAMAFPGMFVGITSVFSFIAGPLLFKVLEMSHIFWICAGLSLLAMLYVLFLLKETGRQEASSNYQVSDLIKLLARWRFLKYVLNGFTINYVLTAVFLMIPLFLRENGQTGLMWIIFVPATLLGVPLMMLASRRADLGLDKLMILLALLLMLISTLFLLSSLFLTIFLSALFFFPSYMILTTLLPAGVTKLSENNIRGTVTATFNTFQFVGSFAGSAISGLLWEIRPLISVITLSAIVTIVMLINLSGMKKPPADTGG